MKRKVMLSLMMTALLASPSAAGAAGKKRLTSEEVKARAAEARTKRKEVVVKLRAGTKVLVGDKARPFEFIKSASLSGKVKEVRENDFTLSDASDGKGEVTAVISYDDVLNIKHPSGFEKVLRAVGKYSLGAAAATVILPLYAVLALMGELPSC